MPNSDIDLGQHWSLAQVMNGLLPEGTKSLAEHVLTTYQHDQVLWHLPEGNFIENHQDFYPWYEFENTNLEVLLHLGANELDLGH